MLLKWEKGMRIIRSGKKVSEAPPPKCMGLETGLVFCYSSQSDLGWSGSAAIGAEGAILGSPN